jgi:hypothetical protein
MNSKRVYQFRIINYSSAEIESLFERNSDALGKHGVVRISMQKSLSLTICMEFHKSVNVCAVDTGVLLDDVTRGSPGVVYCVSGCRWITEVPTLHYNVVFTFPWETEFQWKRIVSSDYFVGSMIQRKNCSGKLASGIPLSFKWANGDSVRTTSKYIEKQLFATNNDKELVLSRTWNATCVHAAAINSKWTFAALSCLPGIVRMMAKNLLVYGPHAEWSERVKLLGAKFGRGESYVHHLRPLIEFFMPNTTNASFYRHHVSVNSVESVFNMFLHDVGAPHMCFLEMHRRVILMEKLKTQMENVFVGVADGFPGIFDKPEVRELCDS